MTIRATILAAVAGLGLVTGSSVKAGHYEHLDELATELRGEVRLLYREFRNGFRHAPGYAHLLSDTTRLYRTAGHIRDVIIRGGSASHLLHDLEELDDAFHHLEDVVANIERHIRSGHGHAHISLRTTRRLMSEVGRTLHHMRDDVGGSHEYVEVHEGIDPGFEFGRPGITFGGHGFAIRIGG